MDRGVGHLPCHVNHSGSARVSAHQLVRILAWVWCCYGPDPELFSVKPHGNPCPAICEHDLSSPLLPHTLPPNRYLLKSCLSQQGTSSRDQLSLRTATSPKAHTVEWRLPALWFLYKTKIITGHKISVLQGLDSAGQSHNPTITLTARAEKSIWSHKH